MLSIIAALNYSVVYLYFIYNKDKLSYKNVKNLLFSLTASSITLLLWDISTLEQDKCILISCICYVALVCFTLIIHNRLNRKYAWFYGVTYFIYILMPGILCPSYQQWQRRMYILNLLQVDQSPVYVMARSFNYDLFWMIIFSEYILFLLLCLKKQQKG